MSLGRAIATVGSFTLLSRIVGFVRDIVLSAVLGSGAVADAFFVAFKLPNFFRRLFAEGAFSAAFVPLFVSGLRCFHSDQPKASTRPQLPRDLRQKPKTRQAGKKTGFHWSKTATFSLNKPHNNVSIT